MTDTRLTQAAVEHWLATNPRAQVTQVALEHWAAVPSVTVRAIATQVAVEHWAVVPQAGGGGTQGARAMVLA